MSQWFVSPTIVFTQAAFVANKPSITRWDSRISHPSIPTTEKVIDSFNLPCSRESNNKIVCEACQKGKRHQLLYLKSNSVLSHLVELMCYDVAKGPLA